MVGIDAAGGHGELSRFHTYKLSTFAVGLCSLQVEEVEFAPGAAEAETGCLNKAKASSRQVEFLLL